MCEYVCVQNTGHLSLCGGARKCLKIWVLEVESPPVVIGHQVLICAPGSCRKSTGPQLEETMVSLHHPNPSQLQITHNKTHMSPKECICFLLSAFDEERMRKIPGRDSNTCLRICQKSGQKSKDNPPTRRQISVRWMTSTMPSTFWLICLHCKVLCISTRMLLHMQNNKRLFPEMLACCLALEFGVLSVSCLDRSDKAFEFNNSSNWLLIKQNVNF